MNVLDQKDVTYSVKSFDEKINRTNPMSGELQFKDGYSPQLWHDFLNKEIPEVVSFLDK